MTGGWLEVGGGAEQRLERLLVVAGRRVGREVQLVAAGHGLRGAHWWLLSELAEPGGDGNPLSELARRGGFATSTATVASDALAVRALIRRDRDPGNRRLVRAWLTPAGRDLAAVIWCELEANLYGSHAVCAPDEQRQLAGFLTRLCTADSGASVF